MLQLYVFKSILPVLVFQWSHGGSRPRNMKNFTILAQLDKRANPVAAAAAFWDSPEFPS